MAADPVVVLVGTLDTKGHELEYMRDRVREAGAEVVLVDVGVLGEPQVTADVSREEVAEAAGADHGVARGRSRPRARGRGHGPRRRRSARPPVRRGAAAGRRCGRRLGQLVDRRGRDARPAGGRAEAHRLHAGLGRHAALRRGQGRDDDVLGRRHRRDQPDLRADPGQRGGRDRRDGEGVGAGGARGPAARRRDDVRRDHPGGHARARAPGGAGLRGARLPRHGHRGTVDGGARRPAASWPACSTSRPPSWPTSSSAASSPRAPTGSRRRAPPACPRSSRSGRWTWSTSAHGHGARALRRTQPIRPQPDVTLMRTTAEENAELGRRIAEKLNRAGSPTVLFVPLGGVSAIDVDGQPFHDPRGRRRRSSTRCASTSTATAWRCGRSTPR